jgi:hypothetical protein
MNRAYTKIKFSGSKLAIIGCKAFIACQRNFSYVSSLIRLFAQEYLSFAKENYSCMNSSGTIKPKKA